MILLTFLQTPAPDIPPIPTPPPWVTLPAPVFVLITVVVVGAAAFVLYPLMRAFARRIEGRSRLDPAIHEELEQLRARAAEVDSLNHRVAELEERVDFTERMLAQRSAPERLPEGR
jgi:Tfp pilus assembly protein PilO